MKDTTAETLDAYTADVALTQAKIKREKAAEFLMNTLGLTVVAGWIVAAVWGIVAAVS